MKRDTLVKIALLIASVGGIYLWWKSSQLPIPDSEKNKPVNAIVPTDWVLGNSSAPIQIVEYSDLQCPACQFYSGFGEQITKDFGDKVGFTYRHFPLRPIHKNANLAAQAAEAAGKQGKFWEMEKVLFEKQEEWSESKQPLQLFVGYAQSLGLDTDRFRREIDDTSIKALVEADYISGLVAKINSTPTFYVNGQKMNNLQGPDDLYSRIELALQEATASGNTQ